jgi:hypothetical protein
MFAQVVSSESKKTATAAATKRAVVARPLPAALQAKLEVGTADDPLEREADRVADRVMRMPDPGSALSVSPTRIQRKCAACEAEDKKLQAKAGVGGPKVCGDAPACVHETLQSPGQALHPATREFFEARFARDFSGVRVHADGGAAASASSINARAYTVGTQIVFAAGQYRTDRDDGRRLLAHELAHVVQQGAAGGRPATSNAPHNRVQREEEDAGAPPAAPAVARELTAEDEASCSPLYLQKLCLFIDGGFNGDRSGVPSDEEMRSRNASCRRESSYPASEPDVQISDAEKAMLRAPKCERGNPAAAKQRAHAQRVSAIMDRAGKYILGGAGDEVVRMFQDPIFLGGLAIAMTAYVAAWLVPEPVFSKIAAVLTTIALLSTGLFSISVIRNVATAWMDLDTDADAAETDDEKEAAAKRFGTRIGAVEADCLVFLASLLVGGKLPGPKGAPQAADALANADAALAAPKPGGVVIEGPWGRAGFKAPPAAETAPRALRFDGSNPLKVEEFPAEQPAPSAPPKAAQAPVPGRSPAPATGGANKPVPVPLAPGTKKPDEKEPEENSMRHQIQRGLNEHFSSLAAMNNARVGVTALQLRTTMAANLVQYMAIARQQMPLPRGWTRGPVEWEASIRSAIIRQSEQITQIVASGGVREGRDVLALRKCFNPRTLAPSNCASDDVRLDVENRGHNLRS